MTSKVKVTVAKSRDQSEPSWPNAVACTCVISGRRRHTVSAETGSHTSCLIWGDLLRITCVRCIRTATWKLTFKSVFIGVHALSKLSYATHATQWKHTQHMQRNGSTRNTCNAMEARLALTHSLLLHSDCKDCTQTARLAAQSNKRKCAMHAHEKQHTQLILFLHVLRFSCACIASFALHTTAWKPTVKSIFCILTAAAVLTFGICNCRPTSTDNG